MAFLKQQYPIDPIDKPIDHDLAKKYAYSKLTDLILTCFPRVKTRGFSVNLQC